MNVDCSQGSCRQDLVDAALCHFCGEDGVWQAQTLVARCLGITRLQLLSSLQQAVTPQDAEKFADWLQRRIDGEPMAYIEGSCGFYGHEFVVDARVLVPRPDSEVLVEQGIAWMQTQKPGLVADLGLGSGCLLFSLLLAQPPWQGIGVDRSLPALQVAALNRRRFGLEGRAALLCGHWLQGWADSEGVDLLVSNPPYIRAGEALGAGVEEHEPHIALFAPGPGLEPYAEILRDAISILRPQGKILLEVGYGHAGEIAQLAETLGWQKTCSFQDLAGVERVVAAEKP